MKKHLCSDVFVCVEGKFLFIFKLLYGIISRSVFLSILSPLSPALIFMLIWKHITPFSSLPLFTYVTSPPHLFPSVCSSSRLQSSVGCVQSARSVWRLWRPGGPTGAFSLFSHPLSSWQHPQPPGRLQWLADSGHLFFAHSALTSLAF